MPLPSSRLLPQELGGVCHPCRLLSEGPELLSGPWRKRSSQEQAMLIFAETGGAWGPGARPWTRSPAPSAPRPRLPDRGLAEPPAPTPSRGATAPRPPAGICVSTLPWVTSGSLGSRAYRAAASTGQHLGRGRQILGRPQTWQLAMPSLDSASQPSSQKGFMGLHPPCSPHGHPGAPKLGGLPLPYMGLP